MDDKKGLRNYLLLVADGAFWQGYITFLDPASVLTLFILAMTGSTVLTGLAMTIMSLAPLIGKLTLGPLTPRIKHLVFYTSTLRFARAILVFMMALPLFLGAPPMLSTRTFFCLFAVYNYLDGAMEVPLGELKSRLLSRRMRGHMSGMALAAGGALSIGAGYVINRLFESGLSVNHQYASIFVLAGLCVLAGFILSLCLREYAPAPKREKPSFLSFYSGLKEPIIKDSTLKRFIVACIPAYFCEIIVNFTVAFGKESGLFSDSVLPHLLMARIIGILAGGLLWGEVSRRRGNRTVIALWEVGCGLIAIASLLPLVLPLPDMWIVVTCFVCGTVAPGWIGRVNYLLDIAPEHKRSEYQVIMSIIGMPFGFMGLAAGLVVSNFGYPALFIGCLIFAVISVLLALRLKHPEEIADLGTLDM